MNRFYVVTDKHNILSIGLHHDACLGLATHAPVDLLSQDIEYWRNKAKDGDVIEINSHLHVICLDVEKLIATSLQKWSESKRT